MAVVRAVCVHVCVMQRLSGVVLASQAAALQHGSWFFFTASEPHGAHTHSHMLWTYSTNEVISNVEL